MKDYRYAISNLKLEDDVYEALVQDALNDIAIKTNFFKKDFMFDIPQDNKILHFDDMAYQAERDEYAYVSLTTDQPTDTGIYMKSFISVVDILFIDSSINTLKNKIYSANHTDFHLIDESTGMYKLHDLNNGKDWKRYLCLYSYIPQSDLLTNRDEAFVRGAIIAKLRYDAYSLYYEQNDAGYLSLLENIYIKEIEKLINSIPQNNIIHTKNLF